MNQFHATENGESSVKVNCQRTNFYELVNIHKTIELSVNWRIINNPVNWRTPSDLDDFFVILMVFRQACELRLNQGVHNALPNSQCGIELTVN